MEVKRWTYATELTPASELDVQTGRMKTFVYASRDNVPDLMTVREGATVTTYRFATDHLGSVRMVVNANCPQTFADAYASCVVWHADYDEYGRRNGPLVKGDENFHSFGFAGGLFDYETGLTRFGRRDYDAQLGRWTARDPILFEGDSPNLYGYVDNDPLNYTDPTGLNPALVCLTPVGAPACVAAGEAAAAGTAALWAAGVGACAAVSVWAIEYINQSKARDEREGDGTKGLDYDEIREKFKDKLKPGEIKKLIEKVQKLRGERNQQKRKS